MHAHARRVRRRFQSERRKRFGSIARWGIGCSDIDRSGNAGHHDAARRDAANDDRTDARPCAAGHARTASHAGPTRYTRTAGLACATGLAA